MTKKQSRKKAGDHLIRGYTVAELDHELNRRRRWPALIMDTDREELVSVETLRAELASTPLDAENREWREWELALAERQAVHLPQHLFYRVVMIHSEEAAGSEETEGGTKESA